MSKFYLLIAIFSSAFLINTNSAPIAHEESRQEDRWKLEFLQGLARDRVDEFFGIVHDGKLSKAEIWKSVEQWAGRQGNETLTKLYEFHGRIAAHVQQSKERLHRILEELPDAIEQLHGIIEDVNASRTNEKKLIDALYEEIDPDTAKTLRFMIELVSNEDYIDRTSTLSIGTSSEATLTSTSTILPNTISLKSIEPKNRPIHATTPIHATSSSSTNLSTSQKPCIKPIATICVLG